MAYKIIDREFVDRDEDKVLFRIVAVLDGASDLGALGKEYAPGSIAMVADSVAPTYILNASGEWKEI